MVKLIEISHNDQMRKKKEKLSRLEGKTMQTP